MRESNVVNVAAFDRVRPNGEQIAELDFSSMLVRLAYGLVGAHPPAGDQYTYYKSGNKIPGGY